MPTFACHRCRQPLHLPSSLTEELTQSAYDVIEAESILLRKDRQSISAGESSKRPGIEGNENKEKQNDGSLSPTNNNALSSHLNLTKALFDMLSSTTPPSNWAPPTKSPLVSTTNARKVDQKERKRKARLPIGQHGNLIPAIDHPLCAECTNILLSVMETQLDELRRERDAYLAFEDEVRRSNVQDTDEATQEEIDELAEQSKKAQQELADAQRESDLMDLELEKLDEEEKRLEEEEKQFWQAYSALSLEASNLSAQRSSLQASLAQDKAQLNRLELTNVYNDAFSIGYDGGYATINGLRLGRMPNDQRGIEWSEINAAWGQTAFLLVTLARRVNIEFEDYKVHPIGSFSTVEKLGERKEIYELYGSGDWQLGRLLTDRRFDHAMVAFLECLRQLCVGVQARDDSVKLPHSIVRDKIGGASIRLQFGSDEIWTRALRNVLMTLKILLAWSINDAPDDDTNGDLPLVE
jgi:beclin